MHKPRGCERWKEGSRAVEGAGVDAQSWHLPRWLGLVSSLAPRSALGQVWSLFCCCGDGGGSVLDLGVMDGLVLPLVVWFDFEKL